MSQGGHVALGVLVGLLSTSIQSLGLTLQRKSHILEDEKDVQDTKRPPYRRRRWQLGMLMFIISNIVGSTIQITTLPLPVLSTLQASGLVFNSICATLILGEAFTRYSLAGTILVAGGALLIALFGAVSEPAHNLDQLLSLLAHRQFIIWIASTILIVIGILAAAHFSQSIRPHHGQSSRSRLLLGMAYGGVSGVLSAHSLLVAKSAVELLVKTIVDHDNQFNRFPSWAILLGLLFLALSQLYFLHRGLKLCSTSVLYPFVFCVYNIIAILDGLIYFRQTDRLSTLSIVLVTLGTVVLLLGVVCLSWRLNQDPGPSRALSQGALTPGLGLVDSETDSEHDSLSGPDYDDRERRTPLLNHSATLPTYLSSPGPTSPSLNYGSIARPGSRVRISSPPGSSRSPNSLRISKVRRSRTTPTNIIPEVDEIWDELLEAEPRPHSSNNSSPALHHTPRRRSFHSRRSLTPQPDGAHDQDHEEDEDESTHLMIRSSTGRTYRDRKPRQTSASASSSRIDDQRRRDRRRRWSSHDVPDSSGTGGWWKMRRWLWKDRDRSGDPGGGSEADRREEV